MDAVSFGLKRRGIILLVISNLFKYLHLFFITDILCVAQSGTGGSLFCVYCVHLLKIF